ncbi:LysR family transcriptional regulator [Rivibacter subsaxonicus]|uniref:DNA-binding transcriptional LysR family regulator n=1 Tax=Rivibacter subsaxonicus TaxID=457575 RepID=A0A4Q7W182_9BURK|nr:LysR family transcriptional regulator [Rivibacter subsaxonicus]RZU02595.1 DNA-binding transcriptional LysR family regulator [Rivibacter subsaxonicus]
MSSLPLDRRNALTPEALAMMDTIARAGSFAAAARELGKVPSALTYSVRQLEDALDVLLFDRSSRQARLTAAGDELLREGRRLLAEVDAVANRVRRVATGWETQLTIALDTILAPRAVFELIEAFYALRVTTSASEQPEPPPTRLRLRHEVLSGTWEALLTGEADLAIGGAGFGDASPGIECLPLGDIDLQFAVAPHHPLAKLPEPLTPELIARHRIVAIADSAHRLAPLTVGVQPGQDVLTVPSLAAKLEAQLRGLGCGSMPEPLLRRHVAAGRLVLKTTTLPPRAITLHYAWREGNGAMPGLALAWWLDQLKSPTTRRALLEQHEGLVL